MLDAPKEKLLEEPACVLNVVVPVLLPFKVVTASVADNAEIPSSGVFADALPEKASKPLAVVAARIAKVFLMGAPIRYTDTVALLILIRVTLRPKTAVFANRYVSLATF